MDDSMSKQLDQARQTISVIDRQLIELLAQRQQAVSQVAKIKNQSGTPLYAPEREAELIADLSKVAQENGVSSTVIEDILRRIFRESYQQQTRIGFKKLSQQQGEVVIVGGAGKLGSLLTKLFERSGYQCIVIEQDNFDSLAQYAKTAQLVLISVPMSQLDAVLQSLPILNNDCILADVSSSKHKALQAMLDRHTGPVVGLHPMFAPNQLDLAKQLILVCHGRHPERYQWLLQQLRVWGCLLQEISSDRHDQLMQTIQGMRHLINFAIGKQLSQSGISIDEIAQVSSPIYRMELALIGRLFAQSSELYADIWLSYPELSKAIDDFIAILQSAKTQLTQSDKPALLDEFEQVAHYFGDWGQVLMQESETLLQMFRDQK